MQFLKNIIHATGNKQQLGRFDPIQISGWARSCASIAADLLTTEHQTEKDFLKLGDNLQDYYTRAQEMNSISGVIVELMTGQEITDAGEKLHSSLDELKKYLGDSVSQFEHMQGMYQSHAKDIARVIPALEEFQQLALNLNILGFLTRVENAHIENKNSGFATLAGDVNKVSESIREKVNTIHKTCDLIAAGVNETIHEASSFSSSHIASAHAKLQLAVKNESVMNKKVLNARDAAHVVNEHIMQISDDISKIVMSQQFHDITRQRVEHIRNVLEHLEKKLKEDSADPPDRIGVMIDTLGLQSAQIAHANEEFSGAMAGLLNSLKTLSMDVHDITVGIDDVAWVTDKNGVSTLQDTKASIQAIIDHIKVMSSKQKELNNKAIEVSTMVATMSTFINDIHAIGLNLEFLALNARIKAAHLGEEGVALDTISGNVYELSRSTRINTTALTEILNNLATKSESFTQNLAERQESNAQTLNSLMEKLTQLTDILSDIGEKVHDKTTEISRLGTIMERDITGTVSITDVHKRIEKILNKSSDHMHKIASEGEYAYPSFVKGSASHLMKELDNLYTMHSERNVHNRHLQDGSQQDTGTEKEEENSSIEFF